MNGGGIEMWKKWTDHREEKNRKEKKRREEKKRNVKLKMEETLWSGYP